MLPETFPAVIVFTKTATQVNYELDHCNPDKDSRDSDSSENDNGTYAYATNLDAVIS